MGQNYVAKMITGSQPLTATAMQLTPPPVSQGEIVTALVASASAFSYSSAQNGVFRAAGLNPLTSQYEKLFPVALAFNQLWFKSASGTITVEWEALINSNA